MAPIQRRDAQRNRQAILDAAAELLAVGGRDVPMYDIARRAGVGQATLYRHFPDRAQLAAAIIEDRVAGLERSAVAHADDPAGFEELLRGVVESQIRMHALVGLLRDGARGQPELQRLTRRTVRAFEAPLRLAQETGRVRGDLVADDVVLLLTMIAGVLDEVVEPDVRRAAAARAMDLLWTGVSRSLP